MGGCENDPLVNGGLGPGPWGHWHIIMPHVGTEIREELGVLVFRISVRLRAGGDYWPHSGGDVRKYRKQRWLSRVQGGLAPQLSICC